MYSRACPASKSLFICHCICEAFGGAFEYSLFSYLIAHCTAVHSAYCVVWQKNTQKDQQLKCLLRIIVSPFQNFLFCSWVWSWISNSVLKTKK